MFWSFIIEILLFFVSRLPLVCVPVPGENIWTNSVRGFPSAFTNHIECDDDRDASDVNTKKRRTRRTESNIGESIGGMDDIPACLLKVYDNMSEPLPTINSDTAQCTGRAVRLNDMIEVVGIYTADDTLELKGSGGMPPMAQGIGLDQSVEEMLLAEEDKLDDQFGESSGEPADVRQERLYPVKLFPRIHCLRFRVLPSTHPLSNYAEVDKAGHCRAHAHVVDTLETVLLGDRLAAEYATLMLLARSNINAAQQQNVEECHNYGNLCLNLCNAINHIDSTTDIRVERLNTFLRELLPRSILLEVNVDSLNAAPMFVCKSASGGRTEPSQLQVGGGTTIVLDETNMGEGVLDGCGLKNIKTLKGFLSEQKLLVECNYYDIHIPTDVAVITFSKANSILSTSGTIHVPLRQVDSSPMDCTNEIDLSSSDSDMQVMREWWARCRHLPRPQMDEAVVQAAERDFLAARGRSTDPEAVSSAVLHRWILTAQLVALAQNAPVLTIEHWEKMQSLEHQVKQRLVPGNV